MDLQGQFCCDKLWIYYRKLHFRHRHSKSMLLCVYIWHCYLKTTLNAVKCFSLNYLKVLWFCSKLLKQHKMCGYFTREIIACLSLTFFMVLIATVSMKLAVERSRMMEWISQVHLPREPREIRSRSWLKVSSLLEPRVVVSPSCSSDIHPKLVQSGSPPLRYSHLPSGVRGVVGMTNTVPFSLSVPPCSSPTITVPSMDVSLQQPPSSSTENSESCLAALCARLLGVGYKGNYC